MVNLTMHASVAHDMWLSNIVRKYQKFETGITAIYYQALTYGVAVNQYGHLIEAPAFYKFHLHGRKLIRFRKQYGKGKR
jgi:hypothetical protein